MFLCLAHKWWPPLKKFAAVEAANATPTASPKFRDVMSQNFARAKLLETTLPSSQPRCRCGPSPVGLAARPHQGPRRYCVCFCYRPCRTSGRIAYDLNRSHSKRPSVRKHGWADLNLVRVYPALSSHWHVRTYDTWPRVTFIWHTPLSICRFSIAVYTGQYRVCQHPPRPAAVGRARV